MTERVFKPHNNNNVFLGGGLLKPEGPKFEADGRERVRDSWGGG